MMSTPAHRVFWFGIITVCFAARACLGNASQRVRPANPEPRDGRSSHSTISLRGLPRRLPAPACLARQWSRVVDGACSTESGRPRRSPRRVGNLRHVLEPPLTTGVRPGTGTPGPAGCVAGHDPASASSSRGRTAMLRTSLPWPGPVVG